MKKAEVWWRSFTRSGLSASSLVEVSVAAVLLSLALVSSVTLYVQVISQGKTLLQLQQALYLDNYAKGVKQEKAFLNEKITTAEGWIIEKKVSYYEGNRKLLLLELILHSHAPTTNETTAPLIYRELIYQRE